MRARIEGRLSTLAGPVESGGVPELAKHGEIGNGRSRGDNGTSIPRGSNSAAYLVAKLKRDRPDIAERLAASGEGGRGRGRKSAKILANYRAG